MVLWCLLTGRSEAWAGETGLLPAVGALAIRVMTNVRPECEGALRPDAPGPAVDLMMRAWAPDPRCRPSATEAAAILAGLLDAHQH